MKRLFSSCLSLALAGMLAVRPGHAQDQAMPPAAHPARDTVYVYERVQYAPARSPMEELSLPALTQKRDHFGRMQQNGFNLLMGGIGMAAGGVALMIIGINRNIAATEEWEDDPYNYDEDAPNDGIGMFFLGYITTLVSPALIITGIILNRIGNGRRLRYEAEMNAREGHGFRFDAGLNSLRLSYSF